MLHGIENHPPTLPPTHLASHPPTHKQVENAAMVVEGVVVKNLNSQWVPNNRGDSWLKIKPDYVKERDIDAVVVGAFYSSGHRGLDAPNLTQFLLALPDRGPTQEGPVMWLSFCKCVWWWWRVVVLTVMGMHICTHVPSP